MTRTGFSSIVLNNGFNPAQAARRDTGWASSTAPLSSPSRTAEPEFEGPALNGADANIISPHNSRRDNQTSQSACG